MQLLQSGGSRGGGEPRGRRGLPVLPRGSDSGAGGCHDAAGRRRAATSGGCGRRRTPGLGVQRGGLGGSPRGGGGGGDVVDVPTPTGGISATTGKNATLTLMLFRESQGGLCGVTKMSPGESANSPFTHYS